MKFRSLSLIACMGFMTSLLCTSPSQVEAILASVKTTGMAATGIAYPQDSEAAAFNPAGMADVGNRFDVGFAWAHEIRKARVHGNLFPVPGINGKFNASRTKDFYHGDFGINKELPWCNATFGVVGYNRNFNKTTYKVPFPLLGTSKLGMEYVHETISPTFAFKLWDRHSFGISVNWMIQRLKVNGIQNFDNVLFSAFPGHVTNREYSYSQGVGFTLGWRGQLCDWLSVGVTYQPETHMSRFKKYKGFLAQRGKLNIPQKIGAGIAIRFLPCATIAFDIEHIKWSSIKALHNPLASNLLVDKLGTSHGSGFGFRNQLYYRIGVDYDINECWTVRAGFRHVKTPIRSSQTAVNLLTVDTIQDFATVGATWCINCCNEVSFFYAHGFNHDVHGHHSIPTVFGLGEVDLKEHSDILAIAWGHSF